MASNIGIRMQWEILRTQTSAAIIAGGGAYVATALLGGPLLFPCRQFKLDNYTDGQLAFSIDGINDHIFMPPFTGFVDDISSNQSFDQGWYLAQGTQFWIRYLVIPTTGNVYLTIAYCGS